MKRVRRHTEAAEEHSDWRGKQRNREGMQMLERNAEVDEG
jgi:hypothetical protein